MTKSGGCLCGDLRYEVTGNFDPLVYCHCSQCRKAQGVGFAANVPVPITDFKIVWGEAVLAAYRSSIGKTRYFCGSCGSAIYSYADAALTVRIRAGTLDDGAGIVPIAHIYSGSKARWVTITDQLLQHPEREPGRE
jgi:hypothetical protein